ncbi:iron chelate uptake ABC transporter family permease subunit [Cellulomonas sp. RIT-PI-Y]|uniref:FecCD family ABC transporter permease n=1 Tax=Cellulomonas sp. RIT-PI-Y TaxID=3035297 RepID=UPI0021D9F46E|nr:iron chelate uptake ABC transporter family permease subunit [Cellulomonas sp. RIT-PI-Y]
MALVVTVGLAVVAGLAVLSLAIGSRDLGIAETWRGLVHRDGTAASIIVHELRLPRTVLAVVVGAALAVAGVVMQALTRNPLAEPGILGVNAGASFAVVLAIALFGVTGVSGYLWFAFAGAAGAAVLVYAMAQRRDVHAGPTRLVLAGVALGASLSAVTGVVTMYRTSAFSSYRYWVIGSFDGRDAGVLTWVAPFLLGGLVLALGSAHTLNALSLGDEQAAALGARVARARTAAFVAITLLCGGATAAAGPISFVGLVVPHAVRLLVGVDQRRVLACSLVAGPALVLAADIVGRVIDRPGEIEVGVVTAFVGAPLLLALVVRGRNVR